MVFLEVDSKSFMIVGWYISGNFILNVQRIFTPGYFQYVAYILRETRNLGLWKL